MCCIKRRKRKGSLRCAFGKKGKKNSKVRGKQWACQEKGQVSEEETIPQTLMRHLETPSRDVMDTKTH